MSKTILGIHMSSPKGLKIDLGVENLTGTETRDSLSAELDAAFAAEKENLLKRLDAGMSRASHHKVTFSLSEEQLL